MTKPITASAAKSLAISYAGFVHATNDLDVVVWGGCLRDDQRETGVVLFETDMLERHIECAKLRRASTEA